VGLGTGLVGLAVRVAYVEVLRVLEEVLMGRFDWEGGEGDDGEKDDKEEDDKEEDDEEEDGGGGQPSGEPSSGSPRHRRPRGLPSRVKSMDAFLRLAKDVVSGEIVLNGLYPVPEASGWYNFEMAFPNLCQVLGGWFEREKVLLYWATKPVGWTWDEDVPSSGSEHDDDDETGSVFDGWGWASDSVKSDFTDDYSD
jgi:hypothetical protein